MNYYIKIIDGMPMGAIYSDLDFKNQFPDIDTTNLPKEFLPVEYNNPPNDTTNCKVEYVIDNGVVKMIYTTL